MIGMDATGALVSSYAIKSSGRPHALTATIEHNTIANGSGLAQITIQVVDETGIPVMLSDNEVTCIIGGPAKLLGLESSANSDMTNWRDNVHRVFNGRILAYIQATGDTGDITARFTAPWLNPVEVKLNK